MTQTRIFVSHSSKDNDWARPFAAALTAIGYDVWYDEMGLQGGAAWVASIQHEVETRDAFLIVLTPEAWESKWVQDELQLAIATRRRIMPVLLRNTQVSGFLLTTQWITVIGEEPQAAARAAVLAIEAPPAPGREAAPVATTETLDELIVLCRSLASEKRYTESLAACARALALDPKNVSVLKIKAWVLHQIGEYRLEGRTCFQILLIDASGFNQSLEAVFNALDDEQEVFLTFPPSFVPRDRRKSAWKKGGDHAQEPVH
jgi:TIR domain-containing protein